MSEDVKEVKERLDKEVEKREAKFNQVYKHMDEHYRTLDQKIDTKFEHLDTKIDELPSRIFKRSGDSRQNTGANIWPLTVFILCIGMLGSGIGFVATSLTHHQDTEGHVGMVARQREDAMRELKNFEIQNVKNEHLNEMSVDRDNHHRELMNLEIKNLKELLEVKADDRYRGSQAQDREEFVDASQARQDEDIKRLTALMQSLIKATEE